MISLPELAEHCRDMANAADVTGIPDAERRLWAALANEIDDYLQPPSAEPALFNPPTQGEPPP